MYATSLYVCNCVQGLLLPLKRQKHDSSLGIVLQKYIKIIGYFKGFFGSFGSRLWFFGSWFGSKEKFLSRWCKIGWAKRFLFLRSSWCSGEQARSPLRVTCNADGVTRYPFLHRNGYTGNHFTSERKLTLYLL